MKRNLSPFESPDSNNIQKIVAIAVVLILVLIMLWYVREAPLPHKFP